MNNQKDEKGDDEAIRRLIKDHFEPMRWTPEIEADWARFSADFLPGALLFPAARPVQPKTLDAFVERMKGLAQGTLQTFEEHTQGMRVLKFGNVAVVLAASEMLENGMEVNHDVSAYLLVKDEGQWRIAAHAWDKASDELPVPDELSRE